MRKSLGVLLLALAACGSDSPTTPPEPQDPFFTEAEWAQIQTLSPLPPLPASPTNRSADNAAAAKLGQKFFFDPRFSGPLVNPDNARPGGNGPVGAVEKISCAGCHQGENLFVDLRSAPNNVSLAVDWGVRNTQSVLNVAFFDFILWDARADSLWMQAIRPVLSHREQGVTMLGLAHVLADHYASEDAAVFGALPDVSDHSRFPATGGPAIPEENVPATASWLGMSAQDQDTIRRIASNFGKAIEAYERKLISGDAKFDRYVAGDHSLFDDSEKRGLRVFLGVAGCVQCHSGPLFSDDQFHNLGLRQAAGPHVPAQDAGAGAALPRLLADPFNGAGPFSDDPTAGAAHLQRLQALAPQPGQFRTASLRNVGDNNRAGTGPYFHNGSQTGLTSVIEFYRRGGDPAGTFVGTKDPKIQPIPESGFQPTQVFDLQAFLWTLSGAPLDPALTSAPPLPP